MKTNANGSWMLYGATGYTGTLIAEEAVRRGHNPILAGRNAEKLRILAKRLKLKWVAFSLEDADDLLGTAASVDLMLHAAGPFAETCIPMMDACLAAKTHYLDISNEISVLQAAQSRHRLAEKIGVSVIPGVGFGTIASNCLVRHVCDRMADPVSLEIAISPYVAQRSAGASKSTLETIARGGYVRRNGELVAMPFGSGGKRIRFTEGERNVLPVPSGDLEAAYMATGIANIRVYMPVSIHPLLARLLLPIGKKIFSRDALRHQVARWIERKQASGIKKPVDENRRSWIRAQATNHHGDTVEAWLEAGEGYAFTASSSVLAAEFVLRQHPVGALAPASILGADFVLQIDGVRQYNGRHIQKSDN